MREAWVYSKNSKKILKTIQSRSDPSGGGGFNRFAHSAGPGSRVHRFLGQPPQQQHQRHPRHEPHLAQFCFESRKGFHEPNN